MIDIKGTCLIVNTGSHRMEFGNTGPNATLSFHDFPMYDTHYKAALDLLVSNVFYNYIVQQNEGLLLLHSMQTTISHIFFFVPAVSEHNWYTSRDLFWEQRA